MNGNESHNLRVDRENTCEWSDLRRKLGVNDLRVNGNGSDNLRVNSPPFTRKLRMNKGRDQVSVMSIFVDLGK